MSTLVSALLRFGIIILVFEIEVSVVVDVDELVDVVEFEVVFEDGTVGMIIGE